jgi:hypothetical protein
VNGTGYTWKQGFVEVGGVWGQVVQTMCTCVSKCKNDKIKNIKCAMSKMLFAVVSTHFETILIATLLGNAAFWI